MLVRRNPGGRRRKADPAGDGIVIPATEPSPIDHRVNLPLAERTFVQEERGGFVVTTYMDPPLTAAPYEEAFPLPLPDAPLPIRSGRKLAPAKD